MRRNIAQGQCEVLILGSLWLCDYTAPVEHEQGRCVHLLVFSVGGNSNAGLRAGVSGLYEWPELLGSLQFLQGLGEFVPQCFIVLPGAASAGLHSDAPALCSHRHGFLGH